MDNKQGVSKEIDLLDILKNFGNVIKSVAASVLNFLLKIVSYFILFGLRKWVPLSILFAIGVAFGAISFFGSEKLIVSDMVIQNNDATNDEIITILNELSIYAQQNNHIALASKMNLDTAITSSLGFIGAYWFIDNDYDGVADYIDFKRDFNQLEDTTLRRVKSMLNVRVKVKQPEYLPQIQEGIISFLESNSVLTRLNKARLNSLETLLDKTGSELEKLGKLQDYEYFEKELETNLDLGSIGSLRIRGEEKDTRLLHNEVLDLESRRQRYEKELMVFSDIVSVKSGFAISTKPEHPFIYVAVVDGLLFAFVGFLLLFIITHRKRMMEFFESQSGM